MKVQRSLFNLLFAFLLTVAVSGSALAGSYDIKEMTPEIKAALDARRARFDQLTSLKAEGKIGENNRGYVHVLVPGSGADELVGPENNDRAMIYNAIISQNGLSKDDISTVEKVFAQVQRDKAVSGDSIQDESGQWIKK